MYVTLVDPQDLLEQEIADKRMKREDVALTYAFAMRTPDEVDWAVVNRQIVERWSLSALKWIKQRAWKLTEQAALRSANPVARESHDPSDSAPPKDVQP